MNLVETQVSVGAKIFLYFLFASVLVCFGNLLQNREQVNEDIVADGDESISGHCWGGVINKVSQPSSEQSSIVKHSSSREGQPFR